MAKANLKVRKELTIEDNGNTIKCMVKVLTIIIMDANMKVFMELINIKVAGKKICLMDKV